MHHMFNKCYFIKYDDILSFLLYYTCIFKKMGISIDCDVGIMIANNSLQGMQIMFKFKK